MASASSSQDQIISLVTYSSSEEEEEEKEPDEVCFEDDYICFMKKCVFLNKKPYCLSCIKDKTRMLLTYEANYGNVHKVIPNNFIHDVGYGAPKTNTKQYYEDPKCSVCRADLVVIRDASDCDSCMDDLRLMYDYNIKQGNVVVVRRG
ncbi:ORF51 [Spodoptera eridania nucleopolyhedrovirus]|uniref:ORF51 n=1 Tax=Spodoptera eridania nucleopolyhedrovirus TaxID=2315721 RepID=A0A346TPY9_9ABAC|nr:ORF51 [Spodoptera eridania nucleopolyhedrovirus]AXU41649.1 ORF51 [Spodoptera eridania nucleopolyhedrovirus]